MPIDSKDLAAASYLRLLVMGPPKVGKTTVCVGTAPEGGVYVVNSDDKSSLRPAQRVRTFTCDHCLGTDLQAIENALKEARTGVKEGRYGTIVWDTITKYAARVEEVFANATIGAKGEPDGRRYWPAYKKHLHGVIDRLFALKAHVIVTAHFLEQSSVQIEGQVSKMGAGIVPALGGAARASIPAEFQDVVFLEKRKGDKRVFVTSVDGVYGPGCRSLPGVAEVDANVAELWRKMQET
jgi:peroxiredoxin